MAYNYDSYGSYGSYGSSWYTPPVVDPYIGIDPSLDPYASGLNPFGVDTWNGDPGSQNDTYDPSTGDGVRISHRGNLVVDNPDGQETVYTRDGRVINERNPRYYSGW